ncbi:MAG TPA: exo-beta-1,3-glucanase [Rhodospirillaceae bacterium]|nr:exo-beta-1,3-glucanase [Rhodospirillaceae bacterium]
MRLVAALLVSLVVAGGLWIWGNRPVMVEPNWDKPLASVSFAPFRRGQSPLTKVYPSPAEVEEDLRSLVGLARGIRTYSSREGMEVVPELAARLGLKVIFGAWLTNQTEAKGRLTNEAEVEALIKAANRYPDAIERVLVGNEVLLRRDLTPEQLIGYIRRVKAAVRQPVSYADVWAFYLKYPEVARELDYLTIHILPFWEDEPVPIDRVEQHITAIVERMRQAFPGKPILIGEAGWPSLGRDRGPAVVSTVNEAAFVRRMADIAERHHFDYNIVEAFDQPWKAALENTVGAAWGVLDVDRKAKFGMSGPVTEVADWPLRAGLALVAGALATIVFGRAIASAAALLVFALLAQGLAWAAVTTAFHAEAVSFRWWQDLWAVFRGGLAAAMALAVADRAAALLAGTGTPLFGRPAGNRPAAWGGRLAIVFAGYAVVWTLLLTVDGRYRDIPDIDFSVPVIGLAALAVIRALRSDGGWPAAIAVDSLFGEAPAERSRLLRWLAGGLVACAGLALISEGVAVIGEDFMKDHPTFAEQAPLVLSGMIANREMILWAVMQLVMAVPFVAAWRRVS